MKWAQPPPLQTGVGLSPEHPDLLWLHQLHTKVAPALFESANCCKCYLPVLLLQQRSHSSISNAQLVKAPDCPLLTAVLKRFTHTWESLAKECHRGSIIQHQAVQNHVRTHAGTAPSPLGVRATEVSGTRFNLTAAAQDSCRQLLSLRAEVSSRSSTSVLSALHCWIMGPREKKKRNLGSNEKFQSF